VAGLPTRFGSRPAGEAKSNAIKPTAYRLSLANGGGLAEQDQEGGLKSVIDVGFLPEQAAANTANHRPMPLDQSGEGQRVLAFEKTEQ
jgi:hypothetical protein